MVTSRRSRATCAAGLVAGPVTVLAILLGELPAHLVGLIHPDATATFADLLVHLAVTVACTGSAWLIVVTALVSATSRCAPGSASTLARMVPRVWRDAVLTVVGVSVLSAPALAHAQTDRPRGSSPDSVSVSGLRLPDRPDSRRSAAQQPRDRSPTGADRVTVRRGDSLWAIAARDLPPGSTAAETARRCAAWYAANRRLVGDDPDLIFPGMSLRPPYPADEGPL